MSGPRAKRLIVNADDLGRSPGVDRGIARAHRDGIVTSATLMANSPHAADGAGVARAHPRLDVGVHLVLTFARPLCDPRSVPSLVGSDGEFPRGPSAIVGTGRVAAEEALREMRAQYARARELIGREPTHLDSHHFVQDEPAVAWAMAELAAETGAVARQQSETQRRQFRARGIRTPDRFCRAFQFEPHIGVGALERLLAEIAAAGAGATELMCHPGEPDEELLATSSYARERATELATLTDPRARAALERAGLTLSTFAELS
jgi:predicted glycoside hydrolase/deacetylase ChbG (UPF0249 family)